MEEWYRAFFGEDYIRVDWHTDTQAEVEGIERMLGLKPGERILDVCCGYGRHAIPLASRGYDVTGVDLSEAMLRHAQADARTAAVRVSWVQADARELPFGEHFDGALNLFTAFGYFAREGDNIRVLQEIARVLVPGGLFLLDTVNHDFLVRHFQPQSWYNRDGVVLLEQRQFDPVESRVEGIWTLVEPDGSQRSYPHSIRVYTFAELRMWLSLVGLDVREVFGGYRGEGLDWDAPRMVIVSEKRKERQRRRRR